jgi:hypothetical protein
MIDLELIYGTHQPVLRGVLNIITKPVLELGCGYFSTELIHTIAEERNLKVVSIESNDEWFDIFKNYESKDHSFEHFDTEANNHEWGLVFIDCDDWIARKNALLKYMNIADYVIVHDCDYFPNNNLFGTVIQPLNKRKRIMGVRTYDDVFKYWSEYFIEGWNTQSPPTLLGSNKNSLKDIKIENMIIANISKL